MRTATDRWSRVQQEAGDRQVHQARRARRPRRAGTGGALAWVLAVFACAAVAGYLGTGEAACLVVAGLVILWIAGMEVFDAVERRRWERDLDRAPASSPPQVNGRMAEQLDFAQLSEDRYLRYFADDFFELWLWYEPDRRSLISFQLAHWSGDRRTEITCREDGRFFVFGFFTEGERALAAVEFPEDAAGRPDIVEEFRSHAQEIDPEVAGHVVRRLEGAALAFAQRN